jgi:hypothetical protein
MENSPDKGENQCLQQLQFFAHWFSESSSTLLNTLAHISAGIDFYT